MQAGYQGAIGAENGAANPYTTYSGALYAPATGQQNLAAINEGG